MIGKNII